MDAKAQQQEGADWASLVVRIQAGEAAAAGEFYERSLRGLKALVARRMGYGDFYREGDDIISETYRITLQAIQGGEIDDAAAVLGFMRTVAIRRVAEYIDDRVQERTRNVRVGMVDEEEYDAVGVECQRQNPEKLCEIQQRRELIRSVLMQLSARDREILVRYYLQEQSQAQIRAEMGMTETQFRLIKSRAKAKFGKIGQKQSRPRLSKLGTAPAV